MRKCACLLVDFVKIVDGKEHKYKDYRLYHNPTIGELQSLRNKGAIILHRVIKRYGNEIHSTWVTDLGHTVSLRIDYV